MQSEIDLLGTQSILDKKGISTKEDAINYFTEGFEIPPQEQVIRDKLLNHFPILKTKTYRESVLKIASSISQLDKFINNFEGKVDNLLHAQQTQFVDSYKIHISKIKDQFEKMNKQSEQLQQKIRYYENEGKMSALVKKVFFLEQQSAKLYKAISQKDKIIKDLQLTLKVQDYELKRMQNAIKLNAREKSQILWKQQQSREMSEPGIKVNDFTIFATELGKKGSISQSNHESFLEQKGGTTFKSLLANDLSPHSMTCQLQKSQSKQEAVTSKSKNNSFIQDQLFKENNRLKNRNKRLVSFQTKVVSQQNQIEQFFINCVQQLKKQIRIRKKTNQCSLQDFKKQDKLLLLIKVLSNNQILTYLHERLFKKGVATKSNSQISGVGLSLGKAEQQGDSKLPKISFNLHYQKK